MGMETHCALTCGAGNVIVSLILIEVARLISSLPDVPGHRRRQTKGRSAEGRLYSGADLPGCRSNRPATVIMHMMERYFHHVHGGALSP